MGSDDAEGQFARRVRLEREIRGLSQAELASQLTAMGVTAYPTTIAKIEARGQASREKARSIRLDEAVALSSILGISIDEISQLDHEMYPGDFLPLLKDGMYEIHREVSSLARRLFTLCDRREVHSAVSELEDASEIGKPTLQAIVGISAGGFFLANQLRLVEINILRAVENLPLFNSMDEARDAVESE